MEETEIQGGVIIKNIHSNRIVGKLSSNPDKGIFTYKETRPFIDFPDSSKHSYKFLGYLKNTKGEVIQKYSVRKKRKHKDKHFTLKCNMTIKTTEITDIKNTDEYKMVTVRLGLPKAAVRDLKDGFKDFLYPKPILLKHKLDTNEILKIIETEPYAFSIIKMLFEKEEISAEDIMVRFDISKSYAIKNLKKMEQHDIITSGTARHNKKLYSLKIDKDKMRNVMLLTFRKK